MCHHIAGRVWCSKLYLVMKMFFTWHENCRSLTWKVSLIEYRLIPKTSTGNTSLFITLAKKYIEFECGVRTPYITSMECLLGYKHTLGIKNIHSALCSVRFSWARTRINSLSHEGMSFELSWYILVWKQLCSLLSFCDDVIRGRSLVPWYILQLNHI